MDTFLFVKKGIPTIMDTFLFLKNTEKETANQTVKLISNKNKNTTKYDFFRIVLVFYVYYLI